MNGKILKILILLLIVVLVAALTLSVAGLLDPLAFWVLAGVSAIFAFVILPKMRVGEKVNGK